MNEQALGLRRRLETARRGEATAIEAVVVVGGRAGVGATSAALALADRLARRRGAPALVVDRAPGPGDAALRLGLDAAGLAAAHELPVTSAAGLDVLRVEPRLGAAALVRRLADLRPRAVVVDAGPASDPIALELLRAATFGVVVVSHDAAAVAGGYAALKGAAARGAEAGRLGLAVNRAPSRVAGERVSMGLLDLTRRFLRLEVAGLGVALEERPFSPAGRRLAPTSLARPVDLVLDRLDPQRARAAQEQFA